MPAKLTKAEVEGLFQARSAFSLSLKRYPHIRLDGTAPDTEEEREKATAAFFSWINDNIEFMEHEVPNYHNLSEQAAADEKAYRLTEKKDGDAYLELLAPMERELMAANNALDKMITIDDNLLNWYSNAAAIIKRRIALVETVEKDVTDKNFSKFRYDENVEGSGLAKQLIWKLKSLEEEAKNPPPVFTTSETADEASVEKTQRDGNCSITMRWTFKK